MYKTQITYTDYVNDNEKRTEEMVFNLNAFELSDLTVQYPGGIGEYMETVLKEERHQETFAVLKKLFVHAYGRRVKDEGSDRYRFVKNPAWLMSLLSSPEFEAFYLRLTSDTQFATNFWNGIVTPELLKRANEIAKTEGKETSTTVPADMSLDEQIKALQAKKELEDKRAANE